MKRTGLSIIGGVEISNQVYNVSKFSSKKLLRFVFSVFINYLNDLVEKLTFLQVIDILQDDEGIQQSSYLVLEGTRKAATRSGGLCNWALLYNEHTPRFSLYQRVLVYLVPL